jgi:dipeptide transport system ATP-binding protein
MTTVLTAENLRRHYRISRGVFGKAATLKALDGASFTLARGRTLAVVGESGCGKSTLARLLAMIEEPSSGEITIGKTTLATASSADKKALRHCVQIVFQNPYGSLNPRQKIGHALEEPLLVNGRFDAQTRTQKARTMLEQVGLRPEHYDRYPHMFSGGQRQRIAIARALMLEPDVVVLDEPVSALDLSIQAQILNLLADLQARLQLAYVFISHDLSVVRHIANDVMVMYLGRVVEQGPAEQVFANPQHPYTQALLSATPVPDPTRKSKRIILKGELPSPLNPPSGCLFRNRCPIAQNICAETRPELDPARHHSAACHFAGSRIA